MFQTVAMIIIPVNTFQFVVRENKNKMDSMKKSLSKLSSPNATQEIVNKIYEII